MTTASTGSWGFDALLETFVLRRISKVVPAGSSTAAAQETTQRRENAVFIYPFPIIAPGKNAKQSQFWMRDKVKKIRNFAVRINDEDRRNRLSHLKWGIVTSRLSELPRKTARGACNRGKM